MVELSCTAHSTVPQKKKKMSAYSNGRTTLYSTFNSTTKKKNKKNTTISLKDFQWLEEGKDWSQRYDFMQWILVFTYVYKEN